MRATRRQRTCSLPTDIPVRSPGAMETFVLIPKELSLVVSDKEPRIPTTPQQQQQQQESQRREVTAAVWSNSRITRGTRFLPFQGTVRLDKLDVFGTLDRKDIRHRFGCYDEIQKAKTKEVRHCNWIRFVRHSPEFSAEVNLLGSLVKGEPVYETIRTVASHTELVVFYEDPDEDVGDRVPLTLVVARDLSLAQYRSAMGMILEGEGKKILFHAIRSHSMGYSCFCCSYDAAYF